MNHKVLYHLIVIQMITTTETATTMIAFIQLIILAFAEFNDGICTTIKAFFASY